jgi:hypothetical protein
MPTKDDFTLSLFPNYCGRDGNLRLRNGRGKDGNAGVALLLPEFERVTTDLAGISMLCVRYDRNRPGVILSSAEARALATGLQDWATAVDGSTAGTSETAGET